MSYEAIRDTMYREMFLVAQGPIKALFLKALIDAFPDALTLDELVLKVYGKRPPARPDDVLRVLVTQMRYRLAATGYRIERSREGLYDWFNPDFVRTYRLRIGASR